MNPWFFLALFFALWTSIGTSITKKLTTKLDLITLIIVQGIAVLPFQLILVILLGGIPSVSLNFYLFIFAAACIDSLTALLSITALKISPISLLAPLSSFNPVFTTIIASVFLHETLSTEKYLGIITIIIGTYILNISELKGGVLLPFKKLFTNRGVLFFMLSNLLWSITPIFQKQAIFETKPTIPLFAAFSEELLITIFFIPFILFRSKKQISQIKTSWKFLLIPAPFVALASLAAFNAFSQAPIGLVTSVFKLSTLFTVGWGFLFFKEERIKERLAGAIVMILGTILLLK